MNKEAFLWPPISGSQVLLGPAREAAWRSEYNCSGRLDKGIFQPRISGEEGDGIVFSRPGSLLGEGEERKGGGKRRGGKGGLFVPDAGDGW